MTCRQRNKQSADVALRDTAEVQWRCLARINIAPKLTLVTLTAVEVTADYAHAKVFYTSLADPAANELIDQGLKHSASFLRRELGQSLRLRKTPELAFVWDMRFEHGEHLNQVISSLDIPPEPAGDELE